MGYIAHHAVVITFNDYLLSEQYVNRDRSPGSINEHDPMMPDLDGFRASLPAGWQRLLVGPIPSMANGDLTVFFAPDGSKEGWDTSDEGDRIRAALIELFANTPCDVVEIRFGGDDPDRATLTDPRDQ